MVLLLVVIPDLIRDLPAFCLTPAETGGKSRVRPGMTVFGEVA
jgi:hypothetical protein